MFSIPFHNFNKFVLGLGGEAVLGLGGETVLGLGGETALGLLTQLGCFS
jgi:hypothetical protein